MRVPYTRSVDIPFPPGHPTPRSGPLSRFLPPLEEGMVRRFLDSFGQAGDRVLDPFGVSPRLAAEAAAAGRAVVVAANNPVSRFVLLHTLKPFDLPQLQSALARLASAPKDGSRLEPFLLDLYETHCTDCGRVVSADHFIWDRDPPRPTHRAYSCPHCSHAAEEPIERADLEKARTYEGRGLQYALALQQVAPAGDPDREHAEAALAVYPGRARYALITLVNKLDQMELPVMERAAVHALLLSAFDSANALWGYPDGRTRPKQLVASARYVEVNVWRALERAVGEWAIDDPQLAVLDYDPAAPLEPGTIAVYAGPMRDLVDLLGSQPPDAILTVLPRPNQAYWTLSALWSAWLWGRETAAPIKMALRRRRYDWSWHASALRATMGRAAQALGAGAPAATFIAESEPGFLEAALVGLDSSGYRLTGRTLRTDTQEALLLWESAPNRPKPQPAGGLVQRMSSIAAEALRLRGEPGSFGYLHAASWSDLGEREQLAPLWQKESGQTLTTIGRAFEMALADQGDFIRVDRNQELESGQFWLAASEGAGVPLGDRVELAVLELLRTEEGLGTESIEARLGQQFPGLLVPSRRLVRACLISYAEEDAEMLWRLRVEDQADQRAIDRKDMLRLLTELGERLEWAVEPSGESSLAWTSNGEPQFVFEILETACLSEGFEAHAESPFTFVLPGGRASLVAFKAARDPRLKAWLESGVRVVKFRHVRRLAEEANLRRERLLERLALDPPEHQDPQLPLL